MPPGSADQLALGQAVRDLRLERDLTQEETARRAGLHVTYVSGIERGERNPSYITLLRIAEAMGIQAHELLARAARAERHP